MPREPVGPGLGLWLGRDQILPHFDQRVGEAARGRALVDRVALERAVIGLVVADFGIGEVGLGAQSAK